MQKMASSPFRGTPRGNGQRELEEGTRKSITTSKMSYATGYLLRMGRDAALGSPMRAPGSHSLGLATRRSSPGFDRTASPIRLKFGRRSPTSPLQEVRWGNGWEDHSENNRYDTASVVAALAKSRKRKTTPPVPLAGEENMQHALGNTDEPSSKRRKQEVEQGKEEAGVGSHKRGSAFLPVSQATLTGAIPCSATATPTLAASHSEMSPLTVEDQRVEDMHAAAPLHTEPSAPSWHRLSTPPVTQWKKLKLPNPNQLREEEGSAEAVVSKHNDDVSKLFPPSGSLSENERTKKEDSVGSVRSSTIRLPEILIDTDSISSSDEQSSTYTSRASTPLLDSSLHSSPISPTPKQQLLMRLRRRYTSGVSPAPAESWDRFKSRLLNKEDESGPRPMMKRQISREDMKKDHLRARTRVRSYLRQFSKEEQQQQQLAEEERKKKEDIAKSTEKGSSIANVAVASSQPSLSGLATTVVSASGVAVAQGQSTLESGLKLPGLSLPSVSSGDGGGGLPASSSVTSTGMKFTMPSLGALNQQGGGSLKMGDTAALTSASVSGSSGLAGTAAEQLAQPKVSATGGGTSSLLLNPLQSSATLSGGGNGLSTSSSQALNAGKLSFSFPSVSVPSSSSVQIGSAQKTSVGAPTLPSLGTQSGSGLNLQFNSVMAAGSNPLQNPTAASNGTNPLSFAAATVSSSSVLGNGIQVPQLGTAAPLTSMFRLGGVFPPAASTASLPTPAVSLPSTTTGGLFSQLGHAGLASSAVNPAGSIFGASSSSGLLGLQQSGNQTLTTQTQSSLFTTPMQGGASSQAGGLSFFGGKGQASSSNQSSVQAQGKGLFGGLQPAQPSLFGNSNGGEKSLGLFNGSQVSQPGSIFGQSQTLGNRGGQGIQQSTSLLGGNSIQPSGSSVFGGQSIAAPQSASIFGNMTSTTSTSGPLSFNASSLAGAAQGIPPNFNFSAQSATSGSTPQLGNLTGNVGFGQPAQGINFSATPQINFTAPNFGTPLGGNAPSSKTPASGRRPIAKATRRSRRN